ncbi:MAG: TatD family hydrolase [Candidatus Bipolaricaulia bacterium]
MRSEPRLIDVHAHLDRFPLEEQSAVLEQAKRTGVRWIITAGMDLRSSQEAIELAREGVLAAVGIHPWVAAEGLPEGFQEEIRRLARKGAAVAAIGEVGLDFVDNVFTGVTYHDNAALRRAQERAFREQLGLAGELRLPLILHCRGAYPIMISILREEKAHQVRGVVHNFSGDWEAARALLDMGFYLSFGGAITYPEATALHEVAREIPLDGLLTETDAPYMPLYLQLGERNEPANVAKVARALAELRGLETAELIGAVYKNFQSFLQSGGI